jgi:hypothetical protein
MADLDMLVGRCSAFRVTVNDGVSRQEIHCLATDEKTVTTRMKQLGYVATRIDRVEVREFLGDSSYERGMMWALNHYKVGIPQEDCYFTRKRP